MPSTFAELAAMLYPLRSGRFTELTYADRPDATVSLYRPNAAARPPLAILFHGGGWTKGSPAKNIVLEAPLMLAGWAVANVRYRLACEAPAPGAVDDAIAALDVCFAAADQYGLDDQRVALFGISAGGILRCVPGWAALEYMADNRPAIVDLYGVVDPVASLDGPAAQPFARTWFGDGPNAAALAHCLSPLRMADGHPAPPPIFIAHGIEDQLVPLAHSQALHDRLAAADGDVELLAVPGGHGDFTLETRQAIFDAAQRFLTVRGVWPES